MCAETKTRSFAYHSLGDSDRTPRKSAWRSGGPEALLCDESGDNCRVVLLTASGDVVDVSVPQQLVIDDRQPKRPRADINLISARPGVSNGVQGPECGTIPAPNRGDKPKPSAGRCVRAARADGHEPVSGSHGVGTCRRIAHARAQAETYNTKLASS